jgi:heme/copper-type cytochrome/quinol oxidase subunit 3
MPNVAIGILSSDAACHAANSKPTIAAREKNEKGKKIIIIHVSTQVFFFPLFFSVKFSIVFSPQATIRPNETPGSSPMYAGSLNVVARVPCEKRRRRKKNYFFFSTQKNNLFFSRSLALRTWPVAAKRHQSLVSLPAAATVVALAAPVVVAAAAVVEVALTSATTAC